MLEIQSKLYIKYFDIISWKTKDIVYNNIVINQTNWLDVVRQFNNFGQ